MKEVMIVGEGVMIGEVEEAEGGEVEVMVDEESPLVVVEEENREEEVVEEDEVEDRIT